MRLHCATKWLATFTAVLLVATFIASLRYHVTIRNPGVWRIEVSGGTARLSVSGVPGGSAPPGPLQFDAGRHSAPLTWWPRRYRRIGWPAADIPLWLLATAFALPSIFFWRRIRKLHAGRCPRCDYDLRGLPPGADCPECGSECCMLPNEAESNSSRATGSAYT